MGTRDRAKPGLRLELVALRMMDPLQRDIFDQFVEARMTADAIEGRIVAEDTPKNLAEGLQGVERLEVEIGGPAAEVLPVLKAIRGVNDVSHVNNNGRHTYNIQAEAGQDLRDVISQVVISNGWSLRGLQMVGMSLEEIFLRLTTHEEL